ncbi:FapA family protein [Robertmurraya korlensis]|uniref:DUF342 domain-containing protein n=1 Tax=Robertmurraya korlensis TaxID=519977 RepID=UPI00203BD936|nr:FapA family protein [Robertmurraya korlensis]MCM3599652.1 FapA family protein [Robertmurraya korlensis]
MDLINNEYFRMEEENGSIFITVVQKGFSLNQLDQLVRDHPRISITKFVELKASLEQAISEKIHIGEWKPLISISISENKMQAKMRIHVTETQLDSEREKLTADIMEALGVHGIKAGILEKAVKQPLANKEFVVAKGEPAITGADAVVRYFQLSVRKPTIREDGKADYFDLHFIDEVKAGDWLGEKIPCTEGVSGRNILGEVLLPIKGKDKPLFYDHKTVEKIEKEGVTTLKAIVDGVVQYKDGKISVGNHLLINGDVGTGTGNIQFDGSVTINGMVSAGFSVKATQDISILGELGISGVKEVESESGDIFIKGGVFGNNITIIKAAKNIFLKHANECTLEAGEDIHIGYYALGAKIKGRNIIANEQKGKIIGGTIEAKGKVSAAVFGNRLERKTFVQVEGFNRFELEHELSELLMRYKEKVVYVEGLKRQLESFEELQSHLNETQFKQFQRLKTVYEDEMMEVSFLEARRKNVMKLLETKGEGQVSIQVAAYPETTLQIKNQKKHVRTLIKGTIYCEKNTLYSE